MFICYIPNITKPWHAQENKLRRSKQRGSKTGTKNIQQLKNVRNAGL